MELGPRGNRRTGRRATGDPENEDRRLLRIVEEDMHRATELAGPWLICAPGCSDCCHGPFPITILDVERLQRGLAHLQQVDPERAAAILQRARSARQLLEGDYPGDRVSGKLIADEQVLDECFARHSKMPCPVLDPRTGKCELYDSRPIACRTYGPPLKYGAEVTSPCRLCFEGAPVGEVERCRVEPDREGLEDRLLIRMLPRADDVWETLIAFAIDVRA